MYRVVAVALSLACLSACDGEIGPAGGRGPDDGAPGDPEVDPGSGPVSDTFATARLSEAETVSIPGDGDLWPSCWSDDDRLYTAWGDGKGFGATWSDLGVGRVTGDPREGDLDGENLAVGDRIGRVWTPGPYNRKPTGMLCVDGDLYLAVQDLNLNFDDAPAATIARSTDKGATWQWDPAGPMFRGEMTTLFFADFGKDGEHRFDDFAYVYGLDRNWRDSFADSVEDPTALYLARVPRGAVQDLARWEYFAGRDAEGQPTWTADLAGRIPVLEDHRRLYSNTVATFRSGPRDFTVLSQGSVVYNRPLERYFYTSWTEYTFEFYEAEAPWGPWRLFMRKDYGGYPWSEEKNGGYATTIPSKFISPDGLHMFVQSNTFMGGPRNYTFSLRDLELAVFVGGAARNRPGEPIPMAGGGAAPLASSLHYGRSGRLSDGDRAQAEDSWTGEARAQNEWGYLWPRHYRMNRLTYVTGRMWPDGGWFDTLAIEVRSNGAWTEVAGVEVTPAYPLGEPAGDHAAYVFRFPAVDGDGIRLIGRPGGGAHFTTIAELAVGYDP